MPRKVHVLYMLSENRRYPTAIDLWKTIPAFPFLFLYPESGEGLISLRILCVAIGCCCAPVPHLPPVQFQLLLCSFPGSCWSWLSLFFYQNIHISTHQAFAGNMPQTSGSGSFFFLIMKIMEPITPMTAVTKFRLNHKPCSERLVCKKLCSTTYVSHYGIHFPKNKTHFFCRCKQNICTAIFLPAVKYLEKVAPELHLLCNFREKKIRCKLCHDYLALN